MRKKNIYKCISFMLFAVMLTGCDPQKIEYGKDELAAEGDKTEAVDFINQGNDTEEIVKIDSPIAKELGIESSWEKEWVVQRDSGGAWSVRVDSEIAIPTSKDMQVVRVKNRSFQQEEKKKIAESLFDDKKILGIGNGGYVTKEKLEEDIEATERVVGAKIEAGSNWEHDSKEKKRLQEIYDNFKEPEIGDYSADLFKGTVNGNPYTLSFKDTNLSLIDFLPDKEAQFFGKSFETLICGMSDSAGDFGENQAAMTEEQAKEAVIRTLDEWGITDMHIAKCCDLNWGEYIQQKDGDMAQEPLVKNGYALLLQRKINDQFVSSQYINGTSIMPMDLYEIDENVDITQLDVLPFKIPGNLWGAEDMMIYIMDEGIIWVRYVNPLSVEEVMAEHASLLSFDNVKSVIEQYATECTSYKENVCYDHMELTYALVGNEDSAGEYVFYLLPVWRIYTINSPLFLDYWFEEDYYDLNGAVINAIDGTLYTGFGKV